MAQPALDWSQLDQALQYDITLTGELLTLLEQERQALETRNYQTFEAQQKEKHRLVSALEQGANTRREWLAKRGFADDGAALLIARAQAPAVAERWQAAAEQWRQCQRASDTNDQICRRTRAVVSNMLDLLRGQSGGGSTYDASGTAHGLQRTRPITSA